MRKIVILAAAAPMALMAGCTSSGSGFANRGAPDEFAVSRQAPLVVPPDFALVPPKPGAPRPQEADSGTQALTALFGGRSARSASERGVLDQAGAARGTAGTRSDAVDPATVVVDKGAVTRDIVAAPAAQGTEATVATPQ